MDFELLDEIVYTCALDNVLPPLKRKSDWGYVHAIQGEYIVMKFYNSRSTHCILPDAISHHPHSPKYIKRLFKACLPGIKAAVEAREARQVMLQKTLISVRLPGPAYIIQDFVTSQKRSKVNLRLLV
jgi:hypothetical protein